MLAHIIHEKGFKKNPFPKGFKKPRFVKNFKYALALMDAVERKKPAQGHVARYRKKYEHTKPLPRSTNPKTNKPQAVRYKNPILAVSRKHTARFRDITFPEVHA